MQLLVKVFDGAQKPEGDGITLSLSIGADELAALPPAAFDALMEGVGNLLAVKRWPGAVAARGRAVLTPEGAVIPPRQPEPEPEPEQPAESGGERVVVLPEAPAEPEIPADLAEHLEGRTPPPGVGPDLWALLVHLSVNDGVNHSTRSLAVDFCRDEERTRDLLHALVGAGLVSKRRGGPLGLLWVSTDKGDELVASSKAA